MIKPPRVWLTTPSHLHLHDVDGVPAPFDFLGSVPSLLDENNSGEAVIQVPEVHGGDAALKVPLRRPQRSRKGAAHSLLKTPRQVSSAGYLQVSVLVEGIIGFDLQFPQAT